MTKQEFVEELRQILSGEVSPEAVMDAYRYYSTYIEEEVQKGKSEEQVIHELGKPSLIARSIIAAHVGEREADIEYTEDGRTRRVWNNPFEQQEAKQKEDRKIKKEKTKKVFIFDFHAWYAKVLFALVFIALVIIAFFMLRFGVWVLITFGIPILIILGIVYLIMYFFK